MGCNYDYGQRALGCNYDYGQRVWVLKLTEEAFINDWLQESSIPANPEQKSEDESLDSC